MVKMVMADGLALDKRWISDGSSGQSIDKATGDGHQKATVICCESVLNGICDLVDRLSKPNQGSH